MQKITLRNKDAVYAPHVEGSSGLWHPMARAVRKYTQYLPRRASRFGFNGRSLPYLCRWYNQTWMNERCVEIPLVMDFVKPGLRILEVGRVLDHYFTFPHDCVDKFEKGAQNIDIVDFTSPEPYDLILTISTLEHVGWDEDNDPEKIFRAIDVLKSHLKPGGKLVATIPLGYNLDLQGHLQRGRSLFQEQYYFEQFSFGRWRQTGGPVFLDYNLRDGAARSLILGVTTG
jgi:hypothetical protein